MHNDVDNAADTDGDRLDRVILTICAEHEGRTICPTQAAKAAARLEGGDELAWRGLLAMVRRAAVRLAKAGRLVIYRKGKPADPDDFRGVYRLGLPNDG